MINEFGEISRAEVLEEALLMMPEIVPFLMKLWGEEHTPIFIASGMNEWTIIEMQDGLFQGNNLSALAFCLGLRRALRRFEEAAKRVEPAVPKRLLMWYIDDLDLRFHLDRAHLLVFVLQESLLTFNFRLNHWKCKVFIPALPSGEWEHGLSKYPIKAWNERLAMYL